MSLVSFRTRILLAACGLALTATTGCSTLPHAGTLPFLGKSAESAESSDPVSTCTVEVRTMSRRPKLIEVPLATDTRVQDVLDACRASRRFRNPEVYVLRPTPESTDPALKLACQFDRKSRRISLEFDYAVLPGDRIVIGEGKSDTLDDLFGSLLGPVLSHR